MSEATIERIIVPEQDADEGKPCEAMEPCPHEAVYLVTFVFHEGHRCKANNPALLCLAHTDWAKNLLAANDLVCVHCVAPVREIRTEPARH